MNPVLYRYRNNESVIKPMEGYTPAEGWEPLYDQAEIDADRKAERVSRILLGGDRAAAADTIRRNHYTRSVPSGKSHYVQFGDAIVVWSIPANKNIAKFVLGWPGNVWELSRLWAPDGHEKNLLTQAISAAVKVVVKLENPDALVSYADPNAGHKGGVYRAASWIYHGKSEEVRTYRAPDGTTVSRRAFHSGRKGLRKAEIEALGYKEEKLPGKKRFVRPISKRAVRALTANARIEPGRCE